MFRTVGLFRTDVVNDPNGWHRKAITLQKSQISYVEYLTPGSSRKSFHLPDKRNDSEYHLDNRFSDHGTACNIANPYRTSSFCRTHIRRGDRVESTHRG